MACFAWWNVYPRSSRSSSVRGASATVSPISFKLHLWGRLERIRCNGLVWLHEWKRVPVATIYYVSCSYGARA